MMARRESSAERAARERLAMPPGADEERAYEAARLAHERAYTVFGGLLCAALVLAWSAFDYYLEPEWLRAFATLRLLDDAVVLVLVAAAARTRKLWSLRVYGVGIVAVTGLLIAVMLPRVHSYGLYVLGSSLTYCGTAVVFALPVRAAAVAYGLSFAAMVGAQLAERSRSPPEDFAWVVLFMALGVGILLVLTHLRRRVEWLAFRLSYGLERENGQLAATLEVLQDAQARMVASERLAASGRLLAGLSHELNNAVNVVQNNLEPLRAYASAALEVLGACRDLRAEGRGGPGGESGEGGQSVPPVQGTSAACPPRIARVPPLLDALARSSEEVRALHADLRSFVRGDALDEPVAARPSDGLRATLALVRRQVPPGVALEVECAELPAFAHWPGQLNQVFFAVLQNALDAVGARGRVRVRARAQDGDVAVEVADSGAGIAPEVAPRIFEPFFTTKGAAEGAGLGLTTSRQIVTRLGGTIVLSPHGELGGATFTILLPVRGRACDSAGRA